MNQQIVHAKHAEILAGRTVIMSNDEIDWLIDHDMHPANVVSIPNPQRIGTLDVYLVGQTTCAPIQAFRAEQDLLTSATRSSMSVAGVWDEPPTAVTPRGWYWPKGTTSPGTTLCAGHYLDYGPGHPRFDEMKATEPGSIHCVVITKSTGRCAASRYVETVDQARRWIESESAKAGHTMK